MNISVKFGQLGSIPDRTNTQGLTIIEEKAAAFALTVVNG